MKSPAPISDEQKPSRVDAAQTILLTIGDTTWRMFVPAVGFTLLGVWLDARCGTKPWLMFGGIAIGCLGAYLLVARQLGAIKKKGQTR